MKISMESLYVDIGAYRVNVRMIFCSHANKAHFHKKGLAVSLVLKVRVSGTWKWSVIGKTYSD